MNSLVGTKAAFLVANGFCEQDMLAAQSSLQSIAAHIRVVSPEQGLVKGWKGSGWGHYFAVDSSLGHALAADYDMLLIPGGRGSIDKLRLASQTKRFLSSFIETGKPVGIFGKALELLIHADNIKGRSVGGPESMRDVVEQSGATWKGSGPVFDQNLITGAVGDDNRHIFIHGMTRKFIEKMELDVVGDDMIGQVA